jgi:ABC-type dipeptide/oligopeptide/nickel transport system permease subunit
MMKRGIKERLEENSFIKLFKIAPKSAKTMTIIGAMLDILLVVFVLFSPYITPYDALEMSKDTLQAPSISHIMGTDLLGRDLFSRLIAGTKYSLGVSLIAVGLSLTIGLLLGSISGYLSGPLDRFLMLNYGLLVRLPKLYFRAYYGRGPWAGYLADSARCMFW